MSDGKIVVRLLRVNTSKEYKNGAKTAFITAVKNRGRYFNTESQEYVDAKPDYLSFQKYIENTETSLNQLALLEDLAKDRTLVEIAYSLKSSTYLNEDNQNRTTNHIRLDSFTILESKAAVEVRLNNKEQIEPTEDIQIETPEDIFD